MDEGVEGRIFDHVKEFIFDFLGHFAVLVDGEIFGVDSSAFENRGQGLGIEDGVFREIGCCFMMSAMRTLPREVWDK